MTEKTIQQIKLSQIDPDPLQPRKNFDPARLADLAKSIEKHGVLQPLVIEKMPTGRYMLIDGERRYRASLLLKLTEIPAIVNDSQSATERLIQQFHLQEQHQGWSAVEKAVAVSELAKNMGYTVPQMAQILSLPARTIADYVAFSNLIDKDSFQKAEIPLAYVSHIVALNTYTRNLWMKHEKEFTREMEKDLEKSIISRIQNGEIKNIKDLTKIKDSITTDHTSVLKIIKGTATVDNLFISTNAKAAMHARMLRWGINSTASHAHELRKLGSKDFLSDAVQASAKKMIEKLQELGIV